MAQSFVRCEDPALLAQAVAAPAAEQLEMRLLAPTVAVSQAAISEVLAALRDAGFAPAAEDSTGTIVDIRARGARVPAPSGRRRAHRPQTPTSQTLGAIVAVLRKVDSASFGSMRLDPSVADRSPSGGMFGSASRPRELGTLIEQRDDLAVEGIDPAPQPTKLG